MRDPNERHRHDCQCCCCESYYSPSVHRQGLVTLFLRLLATDVACWRHGYVQSFETHWAAKFSAALSLCFAWPHRVCNVTGFVSGLPELFVPLYDENDSAGREGYKRFFFYFCTVNIVAVKPKNMYSYALDIYLLYAFCVQRWTLYLFIRWLEICCATGLVFVFRYMLYSGCLT